MYIKVVPKPIAVNFIQKHHYSPVMPRLTKHYIGLYENELVGVLTLGWGTQPLQTIRKLFPDLVTKDYYEIGKMCVDDCMPRNTESQFISLVKKWMKKNTDARLLYTLADGIVGKVGYVYQASNFLYGGFFWTDVYLSSKGEKIHPRTSRQLLKKNAEFVGKEKLFWMTPDFMKHEGIRRIRGKMFRYMLPLDNKMKRRLHRDDNWTIEYPKEDSLEWKEQIDKGIYEFISMPDFNLDVVEHNYNNVNAHKIKVDEELVNIFF